MNELALFAGAGGGILGGHLIGWRTVCAVEVEGYARNVLLARQNDGTLNPFPIWDDVRTFDGTPWRGVVGVVSGGFPCTDLAACGTHKGIRGPKSSLWFEMLRIVSEVEPRHVFIENSPNLRRYLDIVCGGLASLGFACRWGVIGARHTGAPHRRDRMWIVATHPDRERCEEHGGPRSAQTKHGPTECAGRWTIEPDVGRVAHGVAYRVDRLKAIGNGQVPIVAALAWNILRGLHEDNARLDR